MKTNSFKDKIQTTKQLAGCRALFISPTPALSPLLHAQGLPHMRELHRKFGIEFHLLTIEARTWGSKERNHAEEIHKKLKSWGIRWHYFRNGRIPFLPNSTIDVLRGIPVALKLIKRHNISIIHCRSYVPAYMMLVLRRLVPVKFIFDTRNRYPDELVQSDQWSSKSYAYKVSKWLEKKCYIKADSIVVTHDREYSIILNDFQNSIEQTSIEKKISLISNAADLSRFRPDSKIRDNMRKRYGLETSVVFVWVVGGIRKIHLPEEIMDFFLACKTKFPTARLMVITQTPNVEQLLHKGGLVTHDYLVFNLKPEEVSQFVLMGDIGLSFIDENHAASAVKLAEYLASGLPVVINKGQGEVDRTISSSETGIVLEGLSEEDFLQAADTISLLLANRGTITSKCRAVAEKNYSLKSAVQKYAEIYKNLL